MKGKVAIFMKTVGLIGLVLSLLLFPEGKPLQAAEPIKIGVVLSITGFAGYLGTPERQVMTVVVEQLNRQGGLFGRQVELYFEDDQSNPTYSAIAATKLIRDGKVCCVIGGSMADACMSILPICETEAITQFALAPLTIPFKKWTILIPANDYDLSRRMIDFAVNALGARKLASFHDSTIYGLTGSAGVKDHAAKYGATVVIEEQFDVTDTNMIPQLTKIKAANPDAVILFTRAPPAAVVAKNCVRLGYKPRVICGGGTPSPEFPQLAGKIVEGGRWILWGLKDLYGDQLAPDDPFRQNLYDPVMKLLREKYGKNTEWSGFYRNGYDGIRIPLEALKIAGTDDRAAIRDAAEKVKYHGFLADFTYSPTDHQGNHAEAFVPVVIRDGKYGPYKK